MNKVIYVAKQYKEISSKDSKVKIEKLAQSHQVELKEYLK